MKMIDKKGHTICPVDVYLKIKSARVEVLFSGKNFLKWNVFGIVWSIWLLQRNFKNNRLNVA